MDVLPVDPERPDRATLDAAAEAVLRGGVIAFPADTVYGLGCSLLNVAAVELLARLKRRPPTHAVISLIPEPEQAYGLALQVGPVAGRLMKLYWPGPLSLIFLASSFVPRRVQGAGGTVALRCPKDTLSHALLDRIGGPVVSSSANLSGQRPAETAAEVIGYFGNQLDLVLDGGARHQGMPSTLVDLTGSRPKLLRRGALDVTSQLGDFEDLSSAERRLTGAKAPAYPRLRMSAVEPALRVLFVCTGNTCRSPLAAAALREELGADAERVEIQSAGTSALEGQPASEGTREVARGSGMDLSQHRSRRADASLARAADFVFVMETLHQVAIENLGVPRERVHVLSEWPEPGNPTMPVSDPYGASREAYEECWRRIRHHVRRVAPEVRRALIARKPS